MKMLSWYRMSQFVTGRFVRNAVFWLVFTFYHYSGKSLNTAHYFMLLAVLLISYGIPCYINNLVLLPSLLHQRKYWRYAGAFILLLGCTVILSYYLTLAVNSIDPAVNYMGNLKTVTMPYHIFPSMLMFTMFAGAKFTADSFSGQRKLELLENQKLESELSSLKSQVNPHFLFNALNTIYGYSRRHIRDTPETILKLSEILRYVLYDSNVSEISLEKELSFIRQYVEFANLRQRKGRQVCLIIETGSLKEQRIAPLIMLPFVENAIKHGIESRIEGAFAELTVKSGNDAVLHFKCSNNYKRPLCPKPHKGIGLANVKRRLELMYPGRYKLDIQDDGSRFTVILSIQLNEAEVYYYRRRAGSA